MRIMVNTRLLLRDRLEGIGVFSHEVLQRLVKRHPEHEFIFIFDRTPAPEFRYSENVTLTSAFPPSRHPVLWKWWVHNTFNSLIKKWKPDVFLSTDGFIPLHSSIPVVNVIHDINFEYHPEFLPGGVWNFYKKYFPLFAKGSDRLISVSDFSAKTLRDQYQLGEKKIVIAYNAANNSFHPAEDSARVEARGRFSAGKPYFLFVGSLNPRKNLSRLIRAFDLFCKNTSSSAQLLIAGMEMHGTRTESLLDGIVHKDRIHFLGRVSDSDLPFLYGGAVSLVYVPLFEGFGIPVIEAMQCGTPVITSNGTSLPEIAGDAAILVDPHDIEKISKAMVELISDPKKQRELREKGFINTKRFSWDQSAEVIWKAIQDAVDGK